METEAKYVVPDKATFNKILRRVHFGRFTRGEVQTKQVHDTFLDTADRRFYSKRYYVRLRRPGPSQSLLLTIKQLGGTLQGAVHNREEIEAPVNGTLVAEWPEGDARTLVEQIAGDEQLVSLVELDQVRTVWTLTDGERSVAELSLDQVSTVPEAGAGGIRSYELEVELLPDGSLSDLDMVAAWLTEQYPLTPQPLSKFERALLMVSPMPVLQADRAGTPDEPDKPEVPAPTAERADASHNGSGDPAHPQGGRQKQPLFLASDDVEDAARAVVGKQMRNLAKNEQGTLSGVDEGAVHDMRVASRRLRAVLEVLGPSLHGRADRLAKDVKPVTQALGAARDLDVLIENARQFREGLSAEKRADMDGLIDAWSSQRKAAGKSLTKMLGSKSYSRFKKDAEDFLDADTPHRGGAAVEPHLVRHIAGGAIWSRYEALRAFDTVMDAPTVLQLHELRVAAKYLRYTLEFFRDVLDGQQQVLITDLVWVQDQLGDLHDAAVAAQMVRDYREGEQAKKSKKGKRSRAQSDKAEGLDGLTLYLSDREAALRDLYDGALTTWTHISSPEWRLKLASTAASV